MIDITFLQVTHSDVRQYKNLRKIFAEYKRQTLKNHGEFPGNKKMFYDLFDKIIENVSKDANKEFIVMQANNELIGFAYIEYDSHDLIELDFAYGTVCDFYIATKYRRKGYGSLFNTHIETLFTAHGTQTVLLYPDLVSGIDFWKAMGYVPTGIHQGWGRFLVYRKHLIENENTSAFDTAVSALVTPTDRIGINPYNRPQLQEVYALWKEYCKDTARKPHYRHVRQMAFLARKNKDIRFSALYYQGKVIGFTYTAEKQIRYVSADYRKEVHTMSEQNIFDNDVFFEGYRTLRAGSANYNDLLEQPAMAKMLPDLTEKSVLDLGCGYGHNCVDFVRCGASRVVGIDISEKMLNVAKTESSDPKIEYIKMSMTDIKKLGETFDFLYSSLAFHYVKDFDLFAKDLYAVLNDGGELLFSQEHPIITATVDGNGHFNKDSEGQRISYTFSNYNQPGERKVHWYVDGVVKHHRTFGNIINALAKAGFIIEEVCEPIPEDWAIELLPTIVKEYIKPNFLIVKAKK